MNKKSYAVYIVAAVLAVIAIYTIVTFNSLVKKEELVKKQWNEVNSAYQRRLDLIPNLVNVVKGQADFEQTVLTQITEARAKASSITTTTGEPTAENFNKQTAAQNDLASATSRLLITVEKYPTLTTREFSELSELGKAESEQLLLKLTTELKLNKTATRNGDIWSLKK